MKQAAGERVKQLAGRCLALGITSGKGGVGKSAVAANLGVSLGQAGLRVTLLDADMSLANLDVLLGLVPKLTVEHFFRDHLPLSEIVVEGPAGLRLIPAGSGLPELTSLGPSDLLRFVEGLRGLRAECDVLLIDTSSGISDHVSRMLMLADRVLLLTWPEPTALVDAYAALKVLHRRCPSQPVGLVVNGARNEDEARAVHQRVDTASRRFLGRGVDDDGWIPWDEAVAEAARRQRAVVLAHPLSPASQSLKRLAHHVAALARGRLRGVVPESWTSNALVPDLQH